LVVERQGGVGDAALKGVRLSLLEAVAEGTVFEAGSLTGFDASRDVIHARAEGVGAVLDHDGAVGLTETRRLVLTDTTAANAGVGAVELGRHDTSDLSVVDPALNGVTTAVIEDTFLGEVGASGLALFVVGEPEGLGANDVDTGANGQRAVSVTQLVTVVFDTLAANAELAVFTVVVFFALRLNHAVVVDTGLAGFAVAVVILDTGDAGASVLVADILTFLFAVFVGRALGRSDTRTVVADVSVLAVVVFLALVFVVIVVVVVVVLVISVVIIIIIVTTGDGGHANEKQGQHQNKMLSHGSSSSTCLRRAVVLRIICGTSMALFEPTLLYMIRKHNSRPFVNNS
jgi:hypothetical protein